MERKNFIKSIFFGILSFNSISLLETLFTRTKYKTTDYNCIMVNGIFMVSSTWKMDFNKFLKINQNKEIYLISRDKDYIKAIVF